MSGARTAGSPPGVDLVRLRSYLDEAAPGLVAGPLAAELIEGGRSNLTYVVGDGDKTWVLRRPPLGHVLPTAHNMAREHRVITALAPTPVPVPRPILLCPDESVLDAPFYLMEYVDGIVYRTQEQSAALGPDRARNLVESMLDVLADLHAVEPGDVGLADFGRPDGFLERQLRRWRAQLDASRSRPLPGIDELHEILGRTIPVSPPPAIVHGDYRLDNLIIGTGDRIAAVVDWEMTTIGDPLADLGLLLTYWDGLSAIPGSVSAAVGPDTAFPRGSELVAGYARRRPIDLGRLPWYVAFGCFKLAVITEGIHYRYVSGHTVGGGFEGMGEHTLTLVRLGHASLQEE
ncbi:MAG TPA: phosphotransferase family protein [Jiangellaceae bacterium]|nr:phosphotransferase family protein [Jiangellaceae bacterium]